MVPVDHVAAGKARLPQEYQEGVSLPALVAALCSQKQAIEDALQAALAQRTVDVASGATLDAMGRLLDQPRQALSDSRLRTWVRVRSLLDRSSGSIPDIIKMAQMLVPVGGTVQVVESFPCHITVNLGSQVTIDPTDAGAIVKAARAAGIDAVTISPLTPDSSAFTLDDVSFPSPLATQGLGDTGNSSTGGGLATVI